MDLLNETTDPIMGLNLFSLKGRRWRGMRSTLSPAFTSSKMKGMFILMAETAEKFTRHFINKDQQNISLNMNDVYSKYTNDVIANCALGIECNSLSSENEFYNMGKYFTTNSLWKLVRILLSAFFPALFEWLRIPVVPKFIPDYFHKIIKDAIQLRDEQNLVRPDMIHLLMEARKGNLKADADSNKEDVTVEESKLSKDNINITDELITAQALVFFIAGFTTSSSILSFMSYELAVNPQIQEKLQLEIDQISDKYREGKVPYEIILNLKYLDQVVCESLRKYPPGYVLNRRCVKDYPVPAKYENEKNVIIEKGCFITIPAIAIHYSSEYFKEPEKFNPERFGEENRAKLVPGSYMPFGLGPRNCIGLYVFLIKIRYLHVFSGSRFALLQIKALMVYLLRQFSIVPVEKTVIPMQFAKSLSLEAKGGIWLGFQRRK